MKKIILIIFAVIAFLFLFVMTVNLLGISPIAIEQPAFEYIPGRLEVSFKKDVTFKEAESIIKSYGLEVSREYDFSSPEGEEIFNVLHEILINVPEGTEEQWKQKLSADSRVNTVQRSPAFPPATLD